MAIFRRSREWNTLDTTIGANEYSPGGGNNPSVNTSDGRELQGGGCVTFQARNGTTIVCPGSADGTVRNGRWGLMCGSLSWGLTTNLDITAYTGASTFAVNIPSSYFPTFSGYVPAWCYFLVGGGFEAIGLAATAGAVPNNSGDNYLIDNITYMAPVSRNGFDGVYAINGSSSISALAAAESTKSTGFNQCCLLQNGSYFFYGGINIGNSNSSNALAHTNFSETGESFVIVDIPSLAVSQSSHLAWSMHLNASNSSTFAMTNCNYSSGNTGTRQIPTILEFRGSGTSSSARMLNCNILDLDRLTLTDQCTIEGGITRAVRIEQNGAKLSGGTVTTQAASQVATIPDATFSTAAGISETTFIQGGAGHAVSISANTALNGITFQGYGATGQNDAAILVNTTAPVTISTDGVASNVTFRTIGTGNVTVTGPDRVFELKGLKDGTEVRLVEEATNSSIAGVETVSGGVGTGIANGSRAGAGVSVSGAAGANIFNYRYQYSSDTDIFAAIISGSTFEIIYQDFTLGDADTSQEIQQQTDRNYDNPPG